jgi:hypothetical protein
VVLRQRTQFVLALQLVGLLCTPGIGDWWTKPCSGNLERRCEVEDLLAVLDRGDAAGWRSSCRRVTRSTS